MPDIFLDSAAERRRVDVVLVANGLGALALGTRLQSSDMAGVTFTCKVAVNGAYDATAIPDPVQVDATNLRGLFYVELPESLVSSATKVAGDKITLYVDGSGGSPENPIGREIEITLVSSTVTATSAGGASNRAALQINARWKKAESDSRKRSIIITAYDSSGELADPRILFDGTNELLVDPSTGARAAADGTLSNVTKPHTFADITFTTTHASELVNATAHGLKTGDGPFQLENTGGALPAGYSTLTNYWWIWRSANTGQLASSLANALAGTPVMITGDGTGTHKIVDIATTRRLVDGVWRYTASQAEITIDGAYFGVSLRRDNTTGAATNVEDTADVSVLTGTGFLPRHVGRSITVAGFSNGGNNGTFTITAVALDGTTCTYANANGVDETSAATWEIDDGVPEVTVTAELFEREMDQTLVPGVTRVQAERLAMAILAGGVLDFETDTYEFTCPVTGVTRCTGTVGDHGRLNIVLGNLD